MNTNFFTPSFLFNSTNRLGILRAVSPTMFEFVVSSNNVQCSVGDYVVVQVDTVAIFGSITHLESKTRRPESIEDKPEKLTVGLIQPSASINTKDRTVLTGVTNNPELKAEVFSAHRDIVSQVMNPIAHEPGNKPILNLSFASFTDNLAGDLVVTPEMIFGRHCAILGTTGSGKSWSLASLVESCKQYKCKLILLDPSGEYSTLTDEVHSVYIGQGHETEPNALEVTLPYYELRESDLFAIFRPSGTIQGPKLRAAIKSLKLARVASGLGVDGLVFKANREKNHFETAYRNNFNKVEQPNADFDISLLTRQINNECIFPSRSDLEPFVWGDYNGHEQAQVISLINRIQQITTSKELNCIFDSTNKTSLLAAIDTFLNTPSAKVLRISLKHLSFSFNTREIIANAVGRYLLELAREARFIHQPLVIMLDEGHHFLNSRLISEDTEFPLDSFSLISKEGRKYCLTICVATQRPRDLPESVLSQMGTFIVHRIINDNDRLIIERAASQVDSNTISMLPMLSPGEAILLGSEFNIPLHIKVKAPNQKPNSQGPNFQRHWF